MLSRIDHPRRQSGATLIEILVTFLVLAFGILSLGSLQAFSVASAANAANRAVATALAAELTEMIRANPTGFRDGNYDATIDSSTFYTSSSVTELASGTLCVYPNCTVSTLATMDMTTISARLRASLRYGALHLERPGASTTQADVWIVWAESNTYSSRDSVSGSDVGSTERTFDNCPSGLRLLNPLPRCFYVRVTI
jgi:type IV pilus assembly protein PilV